MGNHGAGEKAHVSGSGARYGGSVTGSIGAGTSEAKKVTGVLAIDPGSNQSAWVLWVDDRPMDFGIKQNSDLLRMLRNATTLRAQGVELAIEMIASYGMAVGREVFNTCVWIGRFMEAWNASAELVYRQEIKMHLSNTTKAKDSNIRQALIDRYGDPGTKKAPGILYGVSKDVWAAIAVAVFYSDRRANRLKNAAYDAARTFRKELWEEL
jgi:hypothetical protein